MAGATNAFPHLIFYTSVPENISSLWMLDVSPGLHFPFKPCGTLLPTKCQNPFCSVSLETSRSSSFILFFRWTPVLKEAPSIIIWYQDSVLCHALIVMHGALTVWIRLSVLKIKVFGLFSDSEHFHLPLQNVALCSDEDRGARLRGKRSIS